MTILTHEIYQGGPKLIFGPRYDDNRGYYQVLADEEILSSTEEFAGSWSQISVSSSQAGVYRGIHWQTPPNCQGKLVFCVEGEIEDFFIDLRVNASTFLQKSKVILSPMGKPATPSGIWVPPGFGHGFRCIQAAKITYLTSAPRDIESERVANLRGLFPEVLGDLNIASEKDKNAPLLEELSESEFCNHSFH